MRKIYMLAGVVFGLHYAVVAALETTGAELCASADGNGEYYKWTSGGTLTVPAGGKRLDILLVGGGGAGGFCRGGGGGGGGVIYREGHTLPEGTYTIVIGAGGVPDAWTPDNKPTHYESCYQQVKSTAATCGGDTTLSLGTELVFRAVGGGGGGTFVYSHTSPGTGLAGGCGGGSAGRSTQSAPGTHDQGYAGGMAMSDNDMVSGGGGGAGGPGEAARSGSESGNGGVGFECSITGESIRYAGGGGAGAYESRIPGLGGGGLADAGGAGNGGTGGSSKNANDGMTPGVNGLGGGGGGSSGSGNRWEFCIGAPGGSGVLILREVVASKPTLDHVSATTEGRTLTLSATLVTPGTSPDGSQDATRVIASVACGTDPDQLVFNEVKDDWTLAAAYWEHQIRDLSPYRTYYWAIHVENEFGVALTRDRTGSFFLDGNGRPLPGVATFSDASITYTWTGSGTNGGDPFYAIDGRDDSRVDLNVNDLRLAYDLGEAKHVDAFRMIFPKSGVGDSYIIDRMGNLAVYGSNDKATWTLLTSQAQVNNELYGHSGEWLTYPVLDSGRFRHYEVRGLKYGNLAEMEFLSEEMGLKVDPPVVASSTGLDAADDSDGVSVSGVLTYSPSEATEVHGYCAEEDFDSDETSWAAQGVRFTVPGAFKTGDAFSVKVPVSGKGRRYLRLFAKAGDEKTSSSRTWGFNLATRVSIVPCYVSHGSAPDMQCWYDGNINNYCDNRTSGNVIFDLSKIPPTDYLAGIRIWPRSGSRSFTEWVRHRTMKVSVSYDAGEILGAGETLVGGREVYQVGDASAVTNWLPLNEFVKDAVVPLATVEDFMVSLPKRLRRPHYLKIENVTYNNLNEVELRTVREPPGFRVIVR